MQIISINGILWMALAINGTLDNDRNSFITITDYPEMMLGLEHSVINIFYRDRIIRKAISDSGCGT